MNIYFFRLLGWKKTTLVVGTSSLMCLDSLQPTFNWKNVSNAIPWYLKTSGMTTVIIIINNETQIIWVSVSCWWNEVLSQWYRSSAPDVSLKKLFSWNAANPPELPHSVRSQQSSIATLLKFTCPWVLPQRTATYLLNSSP